MLPFSAKDQDPTPSPSTEPPRFVLEMYLLVEPSVLPCHSLRDFSWAPLGKSFSSPVCLASPFLPFPQRYSYSEPRASSTLSGWSPMIPSFDLLKNHNHSHSAMHLVDLSVYSVGTSCPCSFNGRGLATFRGLSRWRHRTRRFHTR